MIFLLIRYTLTKQYEIKLLFLLTQSTHKEKKNKQRQDDDC